MFTKRITQMPEEELLKAFEELLHLETTGLLGEGYIRQLEREYDYTIQNIRVGILKEMSLRYYNNISKIRKDRRQLDCKELLKYMKIELEYLQKHPEVVRNILRENN